MKKLILTTLFLSFVLTGTVLAQKKLAEFTVVYHSTVSAAAGSTPYSATNTYYIKGNMSRTEVSSSLATFSTIHDSKSGTAVELREVNGQKLLIRMTAENWRDKNKAYDNVRFTNGQEAKTIAGYRCVKATATTADGLQIDVYYTHDLISDNKDYDPMFKSLDGLPLEYTLSRGKINIVYALSSINLNPVPASKFDIPTGGYREMTYDESKKLGGK